jgi:hypothetical protein
LPKGLRTYSPQLLHFHAKNINMKLLLFALPIILLFSCSVQKHTARDVIGKQKVLVVEYVNKGDSGYVTYARCGRGLYQATLDSMLHRGDTIRAERTLVLGSNVFVRIK